MVWHLEDGTVDPQVGLPGVLGSNPRLGFIFTCLPNGLLEGLMYDVKRGGGSLTGSGTLSVTSFEVDELLLKARNLIPKKGKLSYFSSIYRQSIGVVYRDTYKDMIDILAGVDAHRRLDPIVEQNHTLHSSSTTMISGKYKEKVVTEALHHQAKERSQRCQHQAGCDRQARRGVVGRRGTSEEWATC